MPREWNLGSSSKRVSQFTRSEKRIIERRGKLHVYVFNSWVNVAGFCRHYKNSLIDEKRFKFSLIKMYN